MDIFGRTVKRLAVDELASVLEHLGYSWLDLNHQEIRHEAHLPRRAVSGRAVPDDLRTDDGRVAVQGPVLTDQDALARLDGMPAYEAVVLISRELLVEYVRNTAGQP